MLPRPTIEAFDRHLLGLGLRFEGVVIGGSALGLMGIIQRPTRDFDILVPADFLGFDFRDVVAEVAPNPAAEEVWVDSSGGYAR